MTPVRVVLCVALAMFVAAAAPQAQRGPASKPADAPPSSPASPQDGLGRTTPRGTVLGFLSAARNGDEVVAAQYLNTTLRGKAAERLARQLFIVLDTRLPARLTHLSDQPEGSTADPVHRNLDPIGTISREDGELEIVLERVNRADGWIWLFSRRTLEAIPDVYVEVGRDSIEANLPAFLTDTRIAGVRLYEWATLLLGPPLLYLAIVGLNRIVRRRRHGLLSFPIRLLLLAVTIHWILSVVRFPILVRQVWSAAATLSTAVATAWLLMLLNGKSERYVIERWWSAGQAGASSLARVARRAIDVLIVVVIALVTLWSFGVNPTPALAGLGVGGIAVALAAQKTLENVIAGVSLIFDNAVRIGDVLNVGGTIGTVDYIGLRSTRIRTLERTVVSVPNGQVASMTLEALSARDKFWFHPALGLDRQTTAEQLQVVVEGTRRLLAEHPAVDHESIRVRFISLGAFSLDVDVFAYVCARDWTHFLELQEALLFGVMAIVHSAGTAIALAPPPLIADALRRRP